MFAVPTKDVEVGVWRLHGEARSVVIVLCCRSGDVPDVDAIAHALTRAVHEILVYGAPEYVLRTHFPEGTPYGVLRNIAKPPRQFSMATATAAASMLTLRPTVHVEVRLNSTAGTASFVRTDLVRNVQKCHV